MFTEDEIAKELKLTDEQKEKIKTLAEDFGKDVREYFQANQGGDFQEMQKKIGEMRKEATDKVMGILTEDQKKTWNEMVGKPFTIQFPQGQGRGKKKTDN